MEKFCDFAWLADNSDAEMPNLTWSTKLFCGDKDRGNIPKDLADKLKGWDTMEDFSVLTPAGLEFILYMAKEFWRRYGD